MRNGLAIAEDGKVRPIRINGRWGLTDGDRLIVSPTYDDLSKYCPRHDGWVGTIQGEKTFISINKTSHSKDEGAHCQCGLMTEHLMTIMLL